MWIVRLALRRQPAGHWYWVVLMLVAMTLVATQAAVSRLKKPISGRYEIAATAIVASPAITLAWGDRSRRTHLC